MDERHTDLTPHRHLTASNTNITRSASHSPRRSRKSSRLWPRDCRGPSSTSLTSPHFNVTALTNVRLQSLLLEAPVRPSVRSLTRVRSRGGSLTQLRRASERASLDRRVAQFADVRGASVKSDHKHTCDATFGNSSA